MFPLGSLKQVVSSRIPSMTLDIAFKGIQPGGVYNSFQPPLHFLPIDLANELYLVIVLSHQKLFDPCSDMEQLLF